uniref:Uncharacterized protein n=1 Tax=Nelumbo nucifera TaxID=4432 RepID=A0A822Z7W3_NELNU|nr:TPA_asm: hypothetical protein HUJ06_014946 [Nelumbo nucifera]
MKKKQGAGVCRVHVQPSKEKHRFSLPFPFSFKSNKLIKGICGNLSPPLALSLSVQLKEYTLVRGSVERQWQQVRRPWKRREGSKQ